MPRTTPSTPEERAHAQLRTMISRAGGPAVLPPLRELACRWSVSYGTIRRIAGQFADQGKLRIDRGRRVRVIGAADSQNIDTTSSDHLASALQQRILSGEYRVGQRLPKLDYFVVTEKVGRFTVTAAFRRLSRNGLIHKVGKRWVVGPPSPPTPAPIATAKPVVVVVSDSFNSLLRGYTSGFLQPFASSLEWVFDKAQVRKILSSPPRETVEVPAESPFRRIRAAIAEAGSNYLGMLIFATRPLREHLRSWIRTGLRSDRPVVVLDSTPGGFHRHDFRTNPRRYFRLMVDEDAAVSLLLQHLAARGHRTAGVMRYALPGYDWIDDRIERIQREARKTSPPVRVVMSTQTEPLWEPRPWFSGTPDSAKGIPRHALPPNEPLDSLREIIMRESPSVIVALNNRFAQHYSAAIAAAGLSIPRDISLVSFDNTHESRLFPITTMDFGLDTLGYLAAHILLEDIPVTADRRGIIRSKPMLIQRGSLGSVASPERGA